MGEKQDITPLYIHKGWISGMLLPSISSGSIGGAVVGCCFGYLLARPHDLAEAISFGILVGAIVGFVTTWIGAAIVGVFRLFLNR